MMSGSTPTDAATLRRIRVVIGLFIAGLVLSGITAFPLEWELDFLVRSLGADLQPAEGTLFWWVARVHAGLSETHRLHPFMAYGTDWLAFGHLVIALFFIGPWRDPVANAWVLKIGLVACAGVIPLALICGALRGIPFYWRLIDCSFGIFGAFPLLLVLHWCRQLVPTTA
jgi:hypothetical protein